jgi:hypothetical protein
MAVWAVAAGAIFCASSPAAAQGRVVEVKGHLHGSNETPPVSPGTGAFGLITCSVDVDAQVATCRASFWNVPGGIIASHFHAGQNGANGPVVCDATAQTPPQASNDGSYVWTCNESVFRPNSNAGIRSMSDLMESLVSGGLYFNIHTNERPAGEIRGQVCPVLGPGEHNPLTGAEVCSHPKP